MQCKSELSASRESSLNLPTFPNLQHRPPGHVARLNGLGLDHLEGEQRLRSPVGRRSSRGAKIAIPGSAGRGARACRRASKRLRPRRNAARGRSRADLEKDSVRAAITGWGNIPSPRTEKAKRKSPAETKPRSQAWRRRCSMVGTLGRRDGAAVDDVLRAGDGGGARRDEKRDEVGYFRRPGRAPDRNAAE